MFVSGQSVYAGLVFSVLSSVVAIPSAIKVFNWTATLYKGSISYETPMLYALGFIGLFTFGGLTGLFLATLGLDIHVHDTYFIVAHFHYIMVGGTIMAYLGGLHYWWPKISGKMYPEYWSRVVGVRHLHRLQPDVLPAVHPRLPRDAAALLRLPAPSSRCWNVMSTAGRVDPRRSATSSRWSISSGPCATARTPPTIPWGATGLEWETPSPPPTENFPETPLGDRTAVRLPDGTGGGGAEHGLVAGTRPEHEIWMR